MCVQPMKSIAAIALLAKLTPGEIASAGLFVSCTLLFLIATGLLNFIYKIIPICIVRGIQLGTGLSLISKGISNIQKAKGWSFVKFDWMDNYTIAIFSMILIVTTWRFRFSFSALFLFLLGIFFALIKTNWIIVSPAIAFSTPFVPSMNEWGTGIFQAGLGQLPLTLLNSVVATSALADDLFPERRKPVAPLNTVGFCVGMMNSGGLAAQYRFGARTGLSVIILGFIKLICGTFFSSSLLPLFKEIPISLVGVLLVISGLQLALVTVDLGEYNHRSERENAYFVMIITGTAVVGFANDGLGFLVGVMAHLIFHYTTDHESLTLERERLLLKSEETVFERSVSTPTVVAA
ncbi:hypothetical protein HDV02_005754 [Globomyces sp. JEL0801]|nr:hypothetical protein HDV02_005754 [Globomyces sp. JEL0801]